MKSKFCFALSAMTALTDRSRLPHLFTRSISRKLVGSWWHHAIVASSDQWQFVCTLSGGRSRQMSVKAHRLAGGITYMWTNNLAIDLPLALPFKHDLYGAGSIAGVGKIGDTKAIPATVMLQYRFGETGAVFRPYLGIGATYAKFDSEHSTATLSALTGGTPTNPTTTISIESKIDQHIPNWWQLQN
jgi:outer membrane protein